MVGYLSQLKKRRLDEEVVSNIDLPRKTAELTRMFLYFVIAAVKL